MPRICCTINRPNSYNLLVCKKAKLHFIFKYVTGKYNPIKTVFVYLPMSEMQFRIYRLDLYNSQTNRKKLKKLLIFETKLSNNVKTNIISKYDEC